LAWRVGKGNAVTAVGWARMDWNCSISGGLIEVDELNPRGAALAINAALGPSLVHRWPEPGSDAVEALYLSAEVVPSWLRLRSSGGSLLDAFCIPLDAECGFKPYMAISRDPCLERRAYSETQILGWLRHASHLCRRLLEPT
jgi:hypothetical protein